MNNQISNDQNEAIVKALNTAIADGPWDKSNFLRVIGKNLVELRDGFVRQINASSKFQLKAESHLANRVALRAGQQEIFISIYSSDGNNIQTWERIIANLPKQIISRPIYADEEDIKAVLKMKEHKHNEAYVAVYINQTDILPLPPDRASVDKLGKPLLSLKDKTIKLDNISRFVHSSGVYRLNISRLVKI